MSKMDPLDLDQKRKRLATLYHAAHCTNEGIERCSDTPTCSASKRLFHHMLICHSDSDCPVPGCKKSRIIWKHYRKCRTSKCQLCEAVPTKYCSQLFRSRFQKVNRSSSQDTGSVDGASLCVAVNQEGRRGSLSRKLKPLREKENVAYTINVMVMPSTDLDKEECAELSKRLPMSHRPPLSSQETFECTPLNLFRRLSLSLSKGNCLADSTQNGTLWSVS